MKLEKTNKFEIEVDLAKQLQKEGKLDEAIAAYQEAIKIKPKAPLVYRWLAMLQAKTGDVDGAILSYQKAIELYPEKNQEFRNRLANILKQHEAVYEHIWKTLNEIKAEVEESSKFCYPTNLISKTAENYFINNTTYKVIDLKFATSEDQLLLKSYDISLEHLNSIRNDNCEQQSKYFNDFDYHCEIELHPSIPEKSKAREEGEKTAFHQSMIESGYIYTICPTTGRTLRANQSFILKSKLGLYRFVGSEIFYIVASRYLFEKTLIYFPRIDLIVKLAYPGGVAPEKIVNSWKGFAVAHWQQVASYIKKDSPKPVVCLLQMMPNIGHHLRDDLSCIQRLAETERLDKVDLFLVGRNSYYGELNEIFPEIPVEKILKVSHTQLRQLILDNNYFALKPVGTFIQEELAQRIYSVAQKKCSSSFLAEVEQAKQHFPLVWINIRASRHRVWKSQIEGLAQLIQNLAFNFPNAAVVFDGVSRIEINDNSLTSSEDRYIENEQSVVQQILNLLPNNHLPVYNTIGSMMYESIVWANAIDLYVVPAGSGIVKVLWAANKPGVSYGVSSYVNTYGSSISGQRENGEPIFWVSPSYIAETEGSHPSKPFCSYECDWRGIYEEVLKIIPTLSRNSTLSQPNP